MDSSLFSKHAKTLIRQNENKEHVSTLVKQLGITLTESEFTLSGKKIILHVSSAKKTILHTRKLNEFLKEHGYTLSY
jgi:hypothetical protein